MRSWLGRLRHDIVKQAVWRARDLADVAARPLPADLAALERGLRELRDGEGRPTTARALWRELVAELPGGPPDDAALAALDAFAHVVDAAEAAVVDLPSRPADYPAALAAVLALGPAWDELARVLTPKTPTSIKR